VECSLDSPTPGAPTGIENMSPSKENVKIRTQRPGSRLQELEQELAKIHHRGSIFTAASVQPLTPPISNVQTQQSVQNLLTTAQPVSIVPVATITSNIVTSRSGTNTPIQTELQDTTNEVIFCDIFESTLHYLSLFLYILHLIRCYIFFLKRYKIIIEIVL